MLFRASLSAVIAAFGILALGPAPSAVPEGAVLDPMLAGLESSFCLMDQKPAPAAAFDPLD